MNSRVLWVDDRTSDYVGRSWDFKEGIESRGVELVICGEGGSMGMQNRAVACNKSFLARLQDSVENDEVQNIIGFIVDVNMPIENLSVYAEGLREINTGGGAYTGFKVAQYVLANHRRDLSPVGSVFQEKPILFLSISRFHVDANTSWMGDHYSDYDQASTFSKYSHIQKSVARKSLSDSVKKWVDFTKKFQNENSGDH